MPYTVHQFCILPFLLIYINKYQNCRCVDTVNGSISFGVILALGRFPPRLISTELVTDRWSITVCLYVYIAFEPTRILFLIVTSNYPPSQLLCSNTYYVILGKYSPLFITAIVIYIITHEYQWQRRFVYSYFYWDSFPGVPLPIIRPQVCLWVGAKHPLDHFVNQWGWMS